MSLATPTTAQVRDTLVSQIEGQISQSVPLFPKAFIRVLATVQAGIVMLLYKYAGFIWLQMFVARASMDSTTVNGRTIRPLVEWGELIGEGPPLDGVRAELIVSVPVVTQSGTLPAGALYTASNGCTYSVVSPVSLNAATVQATVQAVDDPDGGAGYGAIGNLADGAKLTLAQPLANVSRDATVSSTSVAGEDPEEEDAYRQRVILRFQRRAQGGAHSDYWQWARGASGVVAAYPYASATPGVVEVYIESNVAPDGLSDAQILSDALQAIRFDADGRATRLPITAGAVTRSISRVAVSVEISGLEVSNSSTVLAQIGSSIDSWLRLREPYIEGLSYLPRKDRITQPEIAGIASSVVASYGGTVSSVVAKINGSPFTAYSLGNGEKAKLGTITEV